MGDSHDGGVWIEVLTSEECSSLLERSSVGRVGLNVDLLPVILPINYAVDDKCIVFRSMVGTKLTAALDHTVVAFEVDDYEPSADLGWSVLIQGVASVVTDSEHIGKLSSLGLRHVSPGGLCDHFISLEMTKMTGRRIRPRYDT